MLSIVMYHYVRDLRRSRFPRIKGLDPDSFRGQLDYIARHYAVVTMESVMAAASGGEELPHNAALLTFDDGFVDHFTTVWPLLDERGWQGSFFPCAGPVLRHEVLDVHKIHFVLASVADPRELVDSVFSALDERRHEFDLPSKEQLWQRLAQPSRFDPPEIVFVKRALQRELPEALRREITGALFRTYVTEDETAFAVELYISMDQLQALRRGGMYVGHHGDRHEWLDVASAAQQARAIDAGLDLLRQVGSDTDNWVMCYPYGVHSDVLRASLRQRGCRLGLTTEVALADLRRHDLLALPRLDTNDLPQQGAAEPNRWTREVVAQCAGGRCDQ